VNIPGRLVLDSGENKKDGKNLFEMFRKTVK
jgi:hypothetical protein